jgi:hypothetical protein
MTVTQVAGTRMTDGFTELFVVRFSMQGAVEKVRVYHHNRHVVTP